MQLLKRGQQGTSSLIVRLRSRYVDYAPLTDLEVCFEEATVGLSMPEFNKAVFKIDAKHPRIQIFTDRGHARDFEEFTRDRDGTWKRISKVWVDENHRIREDIKRGSEEVTKWNEALKISYEDLSVSETRQGHLENELDGWRIRLRNSQAELSKIGKAPRHHKSVWMAWGMNKPHYVGLGELGRMVERLKASCLKEFGGVLPRHSEEMFSTMIGVKVDWKQ